MVQAVLFEKTVSVFAILFFGGVMNVGVFQERDEVVKVAVFKVLVAVRLFLFVLLIEVSQGNEIV